MLFHLYQLILLLLFVSAVLCGTTLFFIRAPYGRHFRKGWGLSIDNRLAWAIMESPSVIVFALLFFTGTQRFNPINLFFCGCWLVHYCYRSYLFPLRIRSKHRVMPIFIIASAIVFNSCNSYVNAYWLGHLGQYPLSTLYQPHFIIGMVLFIAGFVTHVYADHILIGLRKPGETDYKIPQGFLYRWICCPNYLGEITQWTGFAIATWSVPGLAFAVYTAANLLPRAYMNLRWYREQFADFPATRRALIPWVF